VTFVRSGSSSQSSLGPFSSAVATVSDTIGLPASGSVLRVPGSKFRAPSSGLRVPVS
jgi:hypothetical protein